MPRRSNCVSGSKSQKSKRSRWSLTMRSSSSGLVREDRGREALRAGQLCRRELDVSDQHRVEAVVQQPSHRVRGVQVVGRRERERRQHREVNGHVVTERRQVLVECGEVRGAGMLRRDADEPDRLGDEAAVAHGEHRGATRTSQPWRPRRTARSNRRRRRTRRPSSRRRYDANGPRTANSAIRSSVSDSSGGRVGALGQAFRKKLG